MSRNVKLEINGMTGYGEVQYFTQLAIQNDVEPGDDKDPEDFVHRLQGPQAAWQFRTVALVSLYSVPDKQLLELSHQTVWSCTNQDEVGLCVVDVTNIQAVITVIPHWPTLPSGATEHQVFVVEKTGLNVSYTGVFAEEDDNDNE
ncbi:hypothetical protein EDD22DRAFT_955429 [Suillus occidentalis]|nr:hypothetical protein EDD22DRAFT_955429 [Suillus occidentalis]